MTMRGILIRLILNAAGLYLAARLVPGITLQGDLWTLLLVALIFGVVNALARPILSSLTCLINVLTLGLFTFVINALMLLLTSWIGTQLKIGFTVDGFVSALLGAVVISVFSFVLSSIIRENRRRGR
jgi:putative membrane protein